jgi:hypothetical protein
MNDDEIIESTTEIKKMSTSYFVRIDDKKSGYGILVKVFELCNGEKDFTITQPVTEGKEFVFEHSSKHTLKRMGELLIEASKL